MCNHCGQTVKTNEQVSELWIHLRGDKASQGAACASFTGNKPQSAEKKASSSSTKVAAQKTKKNNGDGEETSTNNQTTTDNLESRIAAAVEARISAAVASAMRKYLGPTPDSEIHNRPTPLPVRTSASSPTNSCVLPLSTSSSEQNEQDMVDSEVLVVEKNVAVKRSGQEGMWQSPEVEIVEIRSDGICGFRAAALTMNGNVELWADIRTAMSKQLELNQARYSEIWTTKEIERLKIRLGPIETTLKLEQKFWFSSPNCFTLLADLAACPIIRIKLNNPQNEAGEMFPPTLKVPESGRCPTIVLVHTELHYELGVSYKGSLPLIHAQGLQLAKKDSNGRATRNGIRRSLWFPKLKELKSCAFPV